MFKLLCNTSITEVISSSKLNITSHTGEYFHFAAAALQVDDNYVLFHGTLFVQVRHILYDGIEENSCSKLPGGSYMKYLQSDHVSKF